MTSERRVIWKPVSPLSRRVLGSTVVITFCTVAAAAAQQTPDLPVFRTSTAAVTPEAQYQLRLTLEAAGHEIRRVATVVLAPPERPCHSQTERDDAERR
jgi:hypothetical protein